MAGRLWIPNVRQDGSLAKANRLNSTCEYVILAQIDVSEIEYNNRARRQEAALCRNGAGRVESACSPSLRFASFPVK